MAAARAALCLLPLALCHLSSQARTDRRFAPVKRCADEECSMLMCRGKAVEDFSGPDCRFLDFKNGDIIYVYYKLAGGTAELWAGSIGNKFGYFPKDLLKVDQVYCKEELELPTDETDFVCFEGGKDDFDNYNVEELLKKPEEADSRAESPSSVEPKTDSEKENDHKIPEEETQEEDTNESSEISDDRGLDNKPGEKDEYFPELDALDTTDHFPSKKATNLEETLQTNRDDDFIISHESENSQGDTIASQHSEEIQEKKLLFPGDSSHTKILTISQGEDDIQSDEKEEVEAYTSLNEKRLEALKTQLGSTADAIVTDDDTTGHITSTNKHFEDLTLEHQDTQMEEGGKENFEETLLLSYEAAGAKSDVESTDEKEPSAFSKIDTQNNPDEENKSKETVESLKQEKDGKDTLTTLENTNFAIVSDSEHTRQVTDLDGSDSDEQKEKEEDEAKPTGDVKDGEFFFIGMEKIEAQQKEKTADGQLKEYIKENINTETETPAASVLESRDSLRTAQLPEEQNKERFTSRKKTDMEEPQNVPTKELSPVNGPGINSEIEQLNETKQETAPGLGNLEETAVHKTTEQTEFQRENEMEEGFQDKRDQSINIFDKNEDKHRVKDLLSQVQKVSKSEWKHTNFPQSVDEHLAPDEEEKEMTKARGEDSKHIVPEIKKQSMAEQSKKQERNRVKTASENKDSLEKHETEAAAKLSGKQAEETKDIEKTTEQELSSDEVEIKEQKSSNQNVIDNKKQFEKETTTRVDKEMVIQAEAAAGDNGQHNVDWVSDTDSELEEEASEPIEGLLEDENAALAKLSRDKNARDTDIEKAPDLVLTANNIIEQNKRESSVNGSDEINEDIKHRGTAGMNEMLKGTRPPQNYDQSETSGLTEKDRNDRVLPGIEGGPWPTDMSSLNNIRENRESGEASAHLESKPNDNIIEEAEDSPKDLTEKAHTRDKQSEDSVEFNDELLYVEESIEEIIPEYNELVKNLTIMRTYLNEQHIERLLRFLGPHNIFRVEAMFHDMESELKLAQQGNRDEGDIEKALDQILESSESSILDEVERILDSVEADEERMPKGKDIFNEEYIILDDLQEIAYQLRHKYLRVHDSTPLAPGVQESTESGKDVELNKEQSVGQDTAGRIDPEFSDHEGKRPFLDDKDLRMPSAKEVLLDTSISEELDFLYNKEMDDMPASGSANSAQNSMEEFGARAMTDNTMEIEKDELETESSVPSILKSLGSDIQETMNPYTKKLVASLPEDMRPGPDFHGLPWKPIIITALVGAATLAIFLWRTCLSVKSKVYQANEKQLAEKIKNLIQEKSEVLEKISDYEQKMKEAKESVKEARKKNSTLSAEATGLKDSIKSLEEKNQQLTSSMKNLQEMLRTEREQSSKKKDMILETEKSVEKLQEVIAQHSAELSEVQIALSEAKLSEQKLKSDVRNAQEENSRLKQSKEQLLKEAEGWSERHSEMNEQISLYQVSQKDTEEALAYKENEIEVLTNCLMQLKQLDTDLESESRADEESDWDKAGGGDLTNGELSDKHRQKMKSQIRQLMDVSRVKTMLTIIEEDRDLLQTKLGDEISARHELEEQIEKLDHDHSSLYTSKTRLENECKTLHQKVEILTELYQQKEMALQKKLTQEEYERQEKEQKLSVADEKAVVASQEVKVYKQRIQEMEDELEKTEKSYKNQIASHEKKAHDNWLIARSAERTLAEEKRESANLRQKLIEVNQKIAVLQRPSIVKPTPGRPDHQIQGHRGPLSRDGSFGPSPVSGGAPSPPLMIEPPGRPASANLNRREFPRGEFGAVDGSSAPRRPLPEVSGRVSAPDLGRSVTAMLNSGPRTSSPSTMMDGLQNPSKEPEPPSVVAVDPSSDEPDSVMSGSRGPPLFPGTPIMSPPSSGPLPQPLIRFGPPLPRGHYGPRPPPPLIRGLPLPPGARDYLPGLPPGMRELPPGPLPGMRGLPPGPPPEMRGLPLGPPPEMRGLPPGPPPEMRGLTPGPPPEMRGLLPGPPPEMWGPPPEMRGLPPGPPLEMRGLPPGPSPEMRDLPPSMLLPLGPTTDPREYIRASSRYGPVGLRENLSGPPAQRDCPLPARDFLPRDTRDHPPAPPPASGQIDCTDVPEHRR
ncbi:transport and Golgi organization protein 1 homolog isoform X2 [Microcaecilia unicolor]|uniref:Transport and Golgi organization protein 1 homolog n=1 Tax=Microcaecilia unicolor TaxID=1415580 RepID=A0A6P7XN66_9AMPH|nr:transport and Golgi organization protein 1 homolog isoform X2 [Microcaecilia unicolor]